MIEEKEEEEEANTTMKKTCSIECFLQSFSYVNQSVSSCWWTHHSLSLSLFLSLSFVFVLSRSLSKRRLIETNNVGQWQRQVYAKYPPSISSDWIEKSKRASERRNRNKLWWFIRERSRTMINTVLYIYKQLLHLYFLEIFSSSSVLSHDKRTVSRLFCGKFTDPRWIHEC